MNKLILALLCALVPFSQYAQTPVDQLPSEDDWWLPDYVMPTENSGCIFYGFPSDFYYKDNIEIVYVRWKDINPQDGVFNWSELQDSLSGGLDIHFRMDLSDSIHVPQWLFSKYPNLSDSLLQIGSGYTDVFGDFSPSRHVPFWHTGVAAELENLRQEFKQQDFASHPKFHHAYFPFSYDYGEYERPDELYFEQVNWSPQDYLDWFYQFTADWIDAFSGNAHKLVYTGADVDAIFSSTAWRDSIGRKPSVYIVNNGLSARTGLLEKFNFVHTDLPNYGSPLTSINGRNYLVTDEDNTLIGDSIRIWADENEEFCFGDFPCDYYHYKQSILRRLQLRMNWMYTNFTAYEIDTAISRYYDLTAGKTIHNSPDAWCALRSSTDAYIGWTYFPDSQNVVIHNWEKYLFQREVQPNGNTQEVYAIDGDPFRLFNRVSHEAKSTDRVTGNNYIYFDVDDRFLSGAVNTVQIKITYLDNFPGDWFLEYATASSPNAQISISNQNDQNWKTISIDLDDLNLSNALNGNMDFRLYNGGAHDLTVRFVRLIKLEDPISTSTIEAPSPTGLVQLIPNPTKGQFQILLKDRGIDSYAIRNTLGQVLMQGNLTEESTMIDLSTYPSGIYLVTVWDASTNERQSLKMVKH
ncbi:MAG: T9SS type A sorting domain-containing protein [Bacteroidota bacterium]